jgi:hydrogenase nickel incorporation protein HypA/HybF
MPFPIRRWPTRTLPARRQPPEHDTSARPYYAARVHELSIAHSLVELAQQHLPPEATRVVAVDVRIGALAGVVGDALEFCYAIATEGTRLQGSILRVHDVPGAWHCVICDAERTLDATFLLRCQVCGAPAGDLLAGRELELTSIEYDTAEDAPR